MKSVHQTQFDCGGSGEDESKRNVKVSGAVSARFYCRVHPFSIQRDQLSRSLEQARTTPRSFVNKFRVIYTRVRKQN